MSKKPGLLVSQVSSTSMRQNSDGELLGLLEGEALGPAEGLALGLTLGLADG